MYAPNPSRARTGLLLIALALVVASCGSAESDTTSATTASAATSTVAAATDFVGYVRTPPLDVSAVSLPTAAGTPLQMVGPTDGFLIVFFGYTSCPDVCPLTLANLKAAVANQTPEDAERIRFAMVTVDPSVDTAEKLTAYVHQFFPDGAAVRTDDPVELRKAADVFGAEYRTGTNLQGEREVTHSGDLYVIDDTGTVVLGWPFGVTPDDLTGDLGLLSAGDRPGGDGA